MMSDLFFCRSTRMMLMKTGIVLLVLLGIQLASIAAWAQERVKSLNIRQFEIEESIRNGLKYYLEPRDYILRVKLFGEERAASVANESLPGFGPIAQKESGGGEKYWEISSMRVDLVMHKEVSHSVNSYIGEIVPLLSGLDYERGDEFVYVTIIPNQPELKKEGETPVDEEKRTEAGEENTAKLETPKKQSYY